MPSHAALISQTRNWLSDVVIGLGFCPFARWEFEAERIHYAVVSAAEREAQLLAVLDECEALSGETDRETSLLIFPNGLSDFSDYLDVLAMANELLEAEGYTGTYQLASFHPDYRFGGAEAGDAANYTNRSPYPIIHILREASVTRAVEGYPDPENIPVRNIETARQRGAEAMRGLLAACKK